MPENVAAGDPPPRSGAWEGLLFVVEKIPLLGPPLAALGRLSADGRRAVFVILAIGILYPIFSLLAVLLLLRFSPATVQASARDFILSSMGVDQAIDLSNKMIDAEVPITFSPDGHEIVYQSVSTSQNMQFDGTATTYTLPQQIGDCSKVPDLDPDRTLGQLRVANADNSSARIEFDVSADPQQEKIGEINQAKWNSTFGAKTNIDNYPLKISFRPANDLKDDPIFKCKGLRLLVNMTIFKPAMGLPR